MVALAKHVALNVGPILAKRSISSASRRVATKLPLTESTAAVETGLVAIKPAIACDTYGCINHTWSSVTWQMSFAYYM